MAKNFIEKTKERAQNERLRLMFTKRSIEWFRKHVRRTEAFKGNPKRILKEPNLDNVQTPISGKVYLYKYNPKTKKELPYYDTLPLIIMVGPAEGGWYGLNLHYLNPLSRAQFFKKLLDIKNNDRFNERTKILLNYNLLKSAQKYKEFAPLFKHYLSDKVTSPILKVDSQDWEVVTWLPFENFKKSTKQKVWADSKRKIKNR